MHLKIYFYPKLLEFKNKSEPLWHEVGPPRFFSQRAPSSRPQKLPSKWCPQSFPENTLPNEQWWLFTVTHDCTRWWERMADESSASDRTSIPFPVRPKGHFRRGDIKMQKPKEMQRDYKTPSRGNHGNHELRAGAGTCNETVHEWFCQQSGMGSSFGEPHH